ncbi:calcineurin subunit B type 2-like isoform X2 [Ptychodera flava]|uniref:calcineurin subunit B type 2-like isoform X2 n=1 Tax=Ptychodera flava TaxID=63121 RepID=UPI00396A5ED7
MFRRKKALLSDEQIRQLESQTVFSSQEIKKILQRYSMYAEERPDGNYMTAASLSQIPELLGVPLIPRMGSMTVDQRGVLAPDAFVELLSMISPRTSVDQKRRILFAMFDMHNENNIKHDELFRMYKTIFNPTLEDDQILKIVSQILEGTQTPGYITYDEFSLLVPDYEIHERLTAQLQGLS